MTEPIRVLHFADLHIGMENYGKLDPQTGISTRIRDFLDRLDEVINYAFEHDTDLVIFAGDAFKTRDPDPTQQREFARRIKRLADRIPTLLLLGNHDIPGMAAKATVLDIYRVLEVDNIIVGRNIGSQVVHTRRGPLFLAWVPFPVRNRLLAQDAHRGASVEDLDRVVQEIISGELADLALAAAEHDMPRVLVGHFSVAGATYGSERDVMAGRDLVIQKSALVDPAWDYVALGHIHKHQNLTPATAVGLPPIVYSGSLERIDFGEAGEAKGFCAITLERGASDWKFVPVQARALLTIHVDARQAADPTALAVARIQERDIAGAIVRVTVALRAVQEAALVRRDLEQALAPAAYIAGIIVEVEREARLATLGMTPESLTPLQWLERYLEARQTPPEHAERLLRLAGEIIGEGQP